MPFKSLFLLATLACLSINATDDTVEQKSIIAGAAAKSFFALYNTFHTFKSTRWRPAYADAVLRLYWTAMMKAGNDNALVQKLITTLTDYALEQDPTDDKHILECTTYIGLTPREIPSYTPIEELIIDSHRMLNEIAQRFPGKVAGDIIDHFNSQLMDAVLARPVRHNLITILNELGANINWDTISAEKRWLVPLSENEKEKELFLFLQEDVCAIYMYWIEPSELDETELTLLDDETAPLGITTRKILEPELIRKPKLIILPPLSRSTTSPPPLEGPKALA